MKNQFRVERIHTIVVGGGQAGLVAGYHLAKRGVPFLILDANRRIGDAWRNRWDSLRLFTPAQYASLPGYPLRTNRDPFPTKDEIADYLERYAGHFNLPVQAGVRVDRVAKEDGRFVVTAGTLRYEADNVIVAMANYQTPKIPSFARELDPAITQMHANAYKNPSQLQAGGVLVVGVGNSGADIGIELARTHETWLAGKESGHIPPRIDTFFARNFFFRFIRFLGHHVLTLGTPMGRKAYPKMLRRTTPLVRVKPKDLIEAGIKRVGKIVGVRDGKPLTEDHQVLDVKNVVWCTGYEKGFSWIDLPVFDDEGRPKHSRGVATDCPGLYFVGLHFQYAMSSATLIGVGRDAEYVVNAMQAAPASRREENWQLEVARAA